MCRRGWFLLSAAWNGLNRPDLFPFARSLANGLLHRPLGAQQFVGFHVPRRFFVRIDPKSVLLDQRHDQFILIVRLYQICVQDIRFANARYGKLHGKSTDVESEEPEKFLGDDREECCSI